MRQISVSLNTLSRSALSLFVTVLLLAGAAQAQTTAFTYQGRLGDTGMPATGSYDFQFKLFDTLTGGTQIGVIQSNGVAVTSGVFNVTLDYGASAFPGAARFLEISVRLAGGGAFTTLTPRRALNSVPYAVQSLNAATATNATTATNFSGALAGDVTGTQAATTIANNAVTTTKLADGSVTNAKIVDVAGGKVTGTIPVAGVPAGNGNYIQNTTTQQPSSNFNISGNGTAGGTLSGNIVNATTQYNLNGNRVLANSGNENLFAGISAGGLNTGEANAFFGFFAGIFNTTGSSNAFFGNRAGSNNTTANNNSFFGFSAGLNNTTATNNAFFGSEAGTTNTTGSENTFIGRGAGTNNTTGSKNNFFGAFAGEQNTTGSFNTIFGVDAGKSNTTANLNSFFGYIAGAANTTGTQNAFFGANAGRLSTTASENAFFGYDAGQANTTGGLNSFFGRQAGWNNTTGSLNVFIGQGAGGNNTTGANNTAVGTSTGLGNTTGTNNTFIGFAADVTTINGPLTNATAIGYRAQANCNNCLILGSINGINGATASVRVGIGNQNPTEALVVAGNIVATGTITPSDQRYKQNILPISSALDKVQRLRGVSYDWRRTAYPEMQFAASTQLGFIAQEVEQVLPEAVHKTADGMYTLNYSAVTPVLVEAVKELKAENDALKTQNTRLLEESEALKKQNAAIEARLTALEKLLQAGSKQQ